MCTSSRRARNFWFLATKSVSQFSSTSAALPPFTLSPSRPCFFLPRTTWPPMFFFHPVKLHDFPCFFTRLSFMPLFGYFTCDVLRPCNFDAFASPKAWESRVNGVYKKQSNRENSRSLSQWTVEFFQKQWKYLTMNNPEPAPQATSLQRLHRCQFLQVPDIGKNLIPLILNILMLWIVCWPKNILITPSCRLTASSRSSS